MAFSNDSLDEAVVCTTVFRGDYEFIFSVSRFGDWVWALLLAPSRRFYAQNRLPIVERTGSN